MSGFKNPYDPDIKLGAGCSCGRHATAAEHAADAEARALESGSDALHARVVESAVMRALFPHDETRRNFLRAVGDCADPVTWRLSWRGADLTRGARAEPPARQ